LIDTNVLVALTDERDDLTGRATRDLKRLRRGPFASTGTVLAETYYLLPSAYLRRRLRLLLERLNVTIAELPGDTGEGVFDWMERYEEHDPDLTDASLIALCAVHASWRVWTYDREFRTVWRLLDGSRVPAAVR
jgi:predicted nucleic acid-binding protein